MPPLERADLIHTAVLWAADGVDDYSEPVVLAPTEIDCRWVGTQTRALDPQGDTIALDATVIVDCDIAVGSLLWEGELLDLVDGSPPAGRPLFQVKTFGSTDDVRGYEERRSVGVMRYGTKVPRVGT